MTRLRGAYNGSVRWSPDETELVFDGRPTGSADLYVVNVETGAVRQLTDDVSQGDLVVITGLPN